MNGVSLFNCHAKGSSTRNLAARYRSHLLIESKLIHRHHKLLRFESVLDCVAESLQAYFNNDPFLYSAGFPLSSWLLQLTPITLSYLFHSPVRSSLVRVNVV